MPVTLDQFIQNLVSSGLMTAEEVSAAQEGLPPDRRPEDAQALARLLHQHGKLTKYQAAALYQGRTKGLVLGEYEILDRIGAGGMGEVLKARHRTMDRVVALKVVASKAMKSPHAVSRFHREVRAAAKLVHPNIVTAYDASQHEGTHYLVMEFVEGQDLATLVREHGALSVEQAVECIVQAAKGLEYAHSHGVIHRDIKPRNLLLERQGTVKILDMGLARLGSLPDEEIHPSDDLTTAGQVLGTCAFMAPEQAQDAHGADHRADIYSLGCTLHCLLTGAPPFSGDTTIQILLAHQQAPIPSLCDAHPDVPSELDAVYQKMMAKRPEDRQQSMAEVVAELEACLQPVAPTGGPEDSSSDSALRAFLQSLPDAGVAARRKKSGFEETVALPAEHETAARAGKHAAPVRDGKKRMLAGIGAGAAAVVLLIVLALVISGRGREGQEKAAEVATVEEKEEETTAVEKPAEGFLLIDWPQDQREDAKLVIDGEAKDIAELADAGNPNQLRVPLSEGTHNLWAVRRGYEPFETEFSVDAGGEIPISPAWKEFAEAEPGQPKPEMEPPSPEPSAVAEGKPEAEPKPTEVAKPAPPTPEIDPALKRQQELEAKYATAMEPVDAKVAEWDFAGAAELLERIQFEEEELSTRLSVRKDETARLAVLKKKIIDKINSAKPPLTKSDLMIRGVGGDVTGADESAIRATSRTGKQESHSWTDLGAKATSKLLQLAIDTASADDWLAGGLLASAAGDAALGERLLEQAASLGADVAPYRVSVAASLFSRTMDLLEEEEFTEAETLLANIKAKYADTPWFTSYRAAVEAAQAKAKAGTYEVEAEKLYSEGVGLFRKEQPFDVKPVIEKLKTDFADSAAVTDTSRQPSFAEMEKAVADLGRFITVRQDGKGDFASIQEAIDAAPPNSLIEIQDSGFYTEKVQIAKEGLSIRGKRGSWPVIISSESMKELGIELVAIEATGATLERVIIVHEVPRGSGARCLSVYESGFQLRSTIISMRGGRAKRSFHIGQESQIHSCLIITSLNTLGCVVFSNCLILGHPDVNGQSEVQFRFCSVDGTIFAHPNPGMGKYFVVDSILARVQGGAGRIETSDVFSDEPFVGEAKAGEGCFSADPQFLDPKNLDYRLAETSPCKGKASDGGDIGCRYTPEMIEMCQIALKLRAQGIIDF
jgi:serine/threonine protein kinase